MAYKRILTIQDVSCLGQCSLTVALPILSACGHETCIIPSAVLSTHTGEFKGYTFRDLSEDIPLIRKHWEKEKISFDAIYTGYLGSAREVNYVLDIFESLLQPNGLIVVDPAMGDNGRLYAGFDTEYVEAMKKLCAKADVLIPNITEAALLTGIEYKEEYDREYIERLIEALKKLGAQRVVLTGVGFDVEHTGVFVSNENESRYYMHNKIPRMCHGTGDIFASAFTGAYLREKNIFDSAKIAADFTFKSIENTMDDPEHWYGVKFETVLPELIGKLES